MSDLSLFQRFALWSLDLDKLRESERSVERALQLHLSVLGAGSIVLLVGVGVGNAALVAFGALLWLGFLFPTCGLYILYEHPMLLSDEGGEQL